MQSVSYQGTSRDSHQMQGGLSVVVGSVRRHPSHISLHSHSDCSETQSVARWATKRAKHQEPR